MIPHGKVASYGQIASLAGLPGRARLVGQTMSRLPQGSLLPWHRVINSQGRISFPAGSHQAKLQRRLLEMEAVPFDARGQVDFKQVGWQGPAVAYLRQKKLLPPRPLRRR